MFDLQNLGAGAAVGAATVYLAWRTWRLLRGRPAGGCGTGCTGCDASTSSTPNIDGFVPVTELRRTHPR